VIALFGSGPNFLNNKASTYLELFLLHLFS